MTTVRLDLAHEGETFDEAVRDIETRYGVTVTLVNMEGPNGWPEVEISGEVDSLAAAGRGSFGLDELELDELGLLSES